MRRLMLTVLTAMSLAPAVAQAQDDDDRDRDRDRPHHHRSGGLREVDDRQRYARRQGFWLSAGLGGGSESFDANDDLGWSDDRGGGVGYLKLGGTVSPSLLLGAEFGVWGTRYRYEGYDRGLTTAMFIAQWYPAPRSDFWLRGGVGFARDYLDIDGGAKTHENGTALAVGLGYDIRVARNVSISPMLDLQGQHYDSHDERLVNIGLAVTFH